ncbi:hypothetical protein B7G68_12845 [Caulobacter segnis]|uniref:Secreted protein n=2 Tax=Caulobacter segnis TaxID=88688 RepID=D5VKE2_CAUST|nr:hypothetical protein [Caulobacter segnis]ADG10965.1 conserved hypothetical protein [Caulobacter segnis ATCC 21756]AVQ02658.1 hypothetical protein B7G68_12845 [Caulobacter segnis]
MDGMTTWRRNLGGLLAACVLALLVLIPTLASASCICDERPASVAEQTIQADQKHDSAPCRAACCLGGHCHHGGSLIETPVEVISAPAPKTAEHILVPALAPASHISSPLDHPPRA